jgi:hypothetical protein
MFAVLHALGMFVADLFKSQSRLEAENVLLRHQLTIAMRQPPPRLRLRSGDRALLIWMTRLWPSLLDAIQGDGYPGPTYLSWIAVAERLCRTFDRYVAPVVFGSNADLGRGTPAASAFGLRGLLQHHAHALGITERCTAKPAHTTLWQDRRYPSLGWTAPSIRPDMIFGKDRSDAAFNPSHHPSSCEDDSYVPNRSGH